MGKFSTVLISLPAILLLVAGSAQAQVADKQFKQWSTFTLQRGDIKLCYIASEPVNESGDFKDRGQPHVLVTYRTPSKDEFSASAGYPFKPKEPVVVEIDDQKFTLFSEYETAWAYESDQDKQMVGAMKKGKKLVVKGVSHKETTSEDTYSLEGFSAALKRMKEICK